MRARKITMSDACEVTGYTRDQMRGMLRDLPLFAPPSSPRTARTFTRNELLVICVVAVLESRYGLRRGAIVNLIPALMSTLQGPRVANKTAHLNLVIDPCSVTYLPDNTAGLEGIILPLGSIFERVDHYLGGYSEAGTQTELPLGPVMVRDESFQARKA